MDCSSSPIVAKVRAASKSIFSPPWGVIIHYAGSNHGIEFAAHHIVDPFLGDVMVDQRE